jgi:GWxTD domain-containing protein
MNWKALSISLLIAVAGFGALCAQNSINMYLDGSRFLTPNGDTRFELIYKVPFSELTFNLDNGLWQAQMTVTTYLEQDGKRVKYSEAPNRIVTKDESACISHYRFFTDKISLVLSTPMRFIFEAKDENSGKTKTWEVEIPLFGPDDLLSDVEFAQPYPQGDSTGFPRKTDPEGVKAWKLRFLRGDIAYRAFPDHVVDVDSGDPISFYYQGFHLQTNPDDISPVTQIVEIRDDKNVLKTVTDTLYLMDNRFDRFCSIPADSLKEGRYGFSLTLVDPVSGKRQTKEDFILVQARKRLSMRIFPNLDDEFKIVRLFDPSQDSKAWNALSNDGKTNFLDWFWAKRDPSPNTPVNEVFEEIRQRVAFANENYSGYGSGWESDRGKAYIVYGAPDEIEKGVTYGVNQNDGLEDEDQPRAGNLGARDYQVWKYFTKSRQASFLFLDTQTSGNLRLLMKRENGRDEVRYSNWEKLMGSDFDESILD